MFSFGCPTCREVIRVAESAAGSKTRCPRCGQKLRVPSPSESPTVAGELLAQELAPKEAGQTRTLRFCLGLVVVAIVTAGITYCTQNPASLSQWFRGQRAAAPPPAPPTPAPERELSTEEIAARSQESVARITSDRSTGTGFVVRAGILVTNQHVVQGSLVEQIKAHFPSAREPKPLSVKILFEEKKRDLAFLAVNTDLPPLPLTEHYEFKRGQSVTVIGNPSLGAGRLILENAVSRGVMSTQSQLDGIDFLQLSISINPGNSGGPVFDAFGRVIGVITRKATKAEGIAFCIPSGDLRDAIARVAELKPTVAAEVSARHDFGVVFVALASAAAVYVEGLNVYSQRMEAAVKEGKSPAEGLKAASKEIAGTVAAKNKELLNHLLPFIPRATSDPLVAEATRNKLIELWDLYRDMRDAFNKPTGSLESFKKKTSDWTQRHSKLVQTLILSTGEDLD